MKKLFTQKLIINKTYYLQLSTCQTLLNLYQNNDICHSFSLNQKIYTIFKEIQTFLASKNYLTVHNSTIDLYSGKLKLGKNIFLYVTNEHECLTLDFIYKSKDKKELLYIMPLTYTIKTLLLNLNIPFELLKEPDYRYKNVYKFLDMIEILKYQEMVKG